MSWERWGPTYIFFIEAKIPGLAFSRSIFNIRYSICRLTGLKWCKGILDPYFLCFHSAPTTATRYSMSFFCTAAPVGENECNLRSSLLLHLLLCALAVPVRKVIHWDNSLKYSPPLNRLRVFQICSPVWLEIVPSGHRVQS